MLESSLAEFVETQCVPRLSAAAVYRDVKFAKRRPEFLQGMCPFGAGKTPPGSFIVDARTLRWSCPRHCHRGGQSMLSYLNGGVFPRPGTHEVHDALERLAQIAGIPPAHLPPITFEAEQHLAAQERATSLLEAFFVQARWLLQTAPAAVRRSALALLARQGLDTSRLQDLPIGWVDDVPGVRRGLEEVGYSDQEIDASALADDRRLAGRLIGPIRDRFGRILSFWARDPHDRPPKFLFKGPWKDETPLVGLDTALATADPDAGRFDNLVVLERLFDALVLHGLGFAQAGAIVGPASEMTPARWERLAVLGVRRAILVPDESETSRRNALAAVTNSFRANLAPAVWVLSPEALSPYPTAVGFARARGLSEFQALLRARAVHGHHYSALPVERMAPRPPISRPSVVPCLPQEAVFGDLARSPQTAAGFRQTMRRGSAAGGGVDGYCRIHDCDTTVCFCFD